MLSDSVIPSTVNPADLKFYGWKPIILPIDERQRHLSISGTYKVGTKRYLGSILMQDLEHIKYTETFGHLVPKVEHSQLIDQLIFIGSKQSKLVELLKKEIEKKELSLFQLKTENQKRNAGYSEGLPLIVALRTKSILLLEFDESSPEESIRNADKMLKTIFDDSFRESLFSYSLVIEDAEYFIKSSSEFTKYFKKLSRDIRKNQCTISISYQNLENSLVKGFKNNLFINQGNEGKAELTKCSQKIKLQFMPFAPIEPV